MTLATPDTSAELESKRGGASGVLGTLHQRPGLRKSWPHEVLSGCPFHPYRLHSHSGGVRIPRGRFISRYWKIGPTGNQQAGSGPLTRQLARGRRHTYCWGLLLGVLFEEGGQLEPGRLAGPGQGIGRRIWGCAKRRLTRGLLTADHGAQIDAGQQQYVTTEERPGLAAIMSYVLETCSSPLETKHGSSKEIETHNPG
jgi:hypothetical protein